MVRWSWWLGVAALLALLVAGRFSIAQQPAGYGLNSSSIVPVAFAQLPACALKSTEGIRAAVFDSTTQAWGASVAGGGTFHVLLYCDGAHWTVAAR